MKIAEIKGIKIKIHYSTLLILLMVGISSATFYQQASSAELGWIELTSFGVVNGILLLFSIVIHEVMHSLIAQKHGQEIEEIELYLFGGQAKIKDEVHNPTDEMKMAAAGPAASIVFGGLLLLLLYIPWNLNLFMAATFNYIGFANLILAGFNLVPAFPMDGGRILRGYLWKKRGDIVSATKTASKAGKGFAYFLYGLGVIEIFLFGSLGGFWSIIIGNFIKNAAEQSYQQTVYMETLAKMKVRDLVGQISWAIPADTRVIDAIRNYFMPYKHTYFPVKKEDEVIGVLHAHTVQNIPPHERGVKEVQDVMIPLEKIPSVDSSMDAKAAFLEIAQGDSEEGLLAVYNKEHEFIDFLDSSDFRTALYFNNEISKMNKAGVKPGI